MFKKVYRVIKLSQIKPYIDKNTDLRNKTKNDFKKDFFKLINNAVFRKTMENVGKHRDTKFFTTERRNKNYERQIIILQMIVLSISNRN